MSGHELRKGPAMHRIARKRTRAMLVVALVAVGLGLAGPPASAVSVSIDLCALQGTATLTGSVTSTIWGFGIPTTPGDCTTATASLPGPLIRVNEGDVVTLNVINALPAPTAPADHVLKFEIPGITFVPGGNTAAPGGSVTRTFTASAPGTYLYHSSGDAGRQDALGLYGALIVDAPPGVTAQAYDTAASAYDKEAVLVLSAVDPGFNSAPDTADLTGYLATYWLINGKAYPDTAPIAAAAGQRLLIRYMNAGYDNTTMSLLGMHEHVIARDARLLGNPFDADAENLPAGSTEDTIATVPAGSPPSANGYALYNRQMHLSNGALTLPTPAAGGMLTFITP
jgi:FtsP/CotA-like multicopper oxidase with cupredoxin domain